MTIISILLIIIAIGLYLNLYFHWKSNPYAKSLAILDWCYKILGKTNVSPNVDPYTAKDSTNTTCNMPTEQESYAPISEYAKYYKPHHIQTLSEKNVFFALLNILSPYNVHVFPQVSFACIVSGKKNKNFDSINFQRISQKRVDYAIVNNYGYTLFIIELDGKSHAPDDTTPSKEMHIQKLKDKDRDKFWEICGVPTIRISLSEIIDLARSTKNHKTGQLSPYIIFDKLYCKIMAKDTIAKLLKNSAIK